MLHKISSKMRECHVCKNSMGMNYYFNIIDQVKQILKTNVIDFKKASSLESQFDHIEDVFDGSIYRAFLKSTDGESVLNGSGLTFTLNTDGCDIANVTKLKFWPFYLSINEIPLNERYCLENTIIAGISVAEVKPDFQMFLKPIVNELQKFESGIMTDEGRIVKGFLLYGVYDKPARASANNTIASYGYYGCSKCTQEGDLCKMSKFFLNINSITKHIIKIIILIIKIKNHLLCTHIYQK
jgi:hypothetical protein